MCKYNSVLSKLQVCDNSYHFSLKAVGFSTFKILISFPQRDEMALKSISEKITHFFCLEEGGSSRGIWQKEWRKGETRPLCHQGDVSGQDAQAYVQEDTRSKQKVQKISFYIENHRKCYILFRSDESFKIIFTAIYEETKFQILFYKFYFK